MTPVSPIGGGSGFTGEARHWATAVAVTRAKHCWITLSSMARAGFNHTDLHQRENILLSKPSTLSPSRSTPTHTMGNAENCESMRPTTMDSPASGDLSSYVTGLLVIMHCLFAHLITGGHSSTYHSKTKDTLTPTLRQSTSFGDVPASTVPALASQLLQLLFGQLWLRQSLVESLRPMDQLQALAQGLHALASSNPSDPSATEPTS